jgi:hypothetical protein
MSEAEPSVSVKPYARASSAKSAGAAAPTASRQLSSPTPKLPSIISERSHPG